MVSNAIFVHSFWFNEIYGSMRWKTSQVIVSLMFTFIGVCWDDKKFQPIFHFNSLWPKQNGHHFTDDVFECISFKLCENLRILIRISLNLKFFPVGLVDNKPAFGSDNIAKQATSHYLNQWWYSSITHNKGLINLVTKMLIYRFLWTNFAMLSDVWKHWRTPWGL